GCRDMVFSPDGRWLVVSSRFGGLHRWDLAQEATSAISWHTGADDDAFLAFGVARPVLLTHGKGQIRAWNAAANWSETGRLTDPVHIGRPTVDTITGRVAYWSHQRLNLLDGRTHEQCVPPVKTSGFWGHLFLSPDGRT